MVISEHEILSHSELESPLQAADQETKNHAFTTALGRQSSIYSLTLDEFQHTLCDGGKNFGSMNMDEFLNNIWNAEENQAFNNNITPTIAAAAATTATNSISSRKNANDNSIHLSLSKAPSDDKMIAKQPSLARQGSLTLPQPLCRKTVDEVWSEIHKSQQGQQQTNNNNVQNSSDSAPRQPTFGEMTLEDFLIRAGVVREQCSAQVPQQPPQQYALYQNNNNHPTMGPTFVSRTPVIGVTGGGGGSGVATFQTLPPHGGSGVGESSSTYTGNGKQSSSGYPSPPVCYGGRVGPGGGGGGGSGFGSAQPMGMEATVSPVSSDGMCTNQVDNAGNQYGLDMGGLRGRKRILDGPVEKVVERRQRRMIKNRESAARSRARKQAYTVELEAELNQLREENTHLKQTLAELERKRTQQYFEEVKIRAPTKAQKAKEKLRVIRRTSSCQL